MAAAVGLVLAANVVLMEDLYRYLERLGGAHGTFCSMLGHKRAAARFVAERGNPRQLMGEGRLVQLMDDSYRQARPAEIELGFLAVEEGLAPTQFGWETNTVVIVVDENRSNFPPPVWNQLRSMNHTNFGPIHLIITTRE